MALVTYNLSQFADIARSNRLEDSIRGWGGNDLLMDGSAYGQTDIDYMSGDAGDDILHGRWGIDVLKGSVGNDTLVSRSDAGEPGIAQNPALPKHFANENLTAANDILNGGIGRDKFLFRLDFNATQEIIVKHTDRAGEINWEGVAGENASPHLHWVEGIGNDTIQDFYRAEGDRIVIEGHTVTASLAYGDFNRDGRMDNTVITLRSDQGGPGSHQGDILGTIRVFGDLVTADDLMIDAEAHHGIYDEIDDSFAWTARVGTEGNDVLRTITLNDTIKGLGGDDMIIDGSRQRETDTDTFSGGDGNDTIRSHWGADVLIGGNGDDLLVSRSDAGEPVIAQATTQAKYHAGEPFLTANDSMTGGLGADTFFFRFDLDAMRNIVARHTEADGHIHWHDVAGENRSPHLHWLESIGTDTIKDFYKSEGDTIKLEGHTANLLRITYQDLDRDGRTDVSLLTISSNQGGPGAHNGDIVGYIRVFGEKVNWWDVSVNAGPTHGVANTIDDWGLI